LRDLRQIQVRIGLVPIVGKKSLAIFQLATYTCSFESVVKLIAPPSVSNIGHCMFTSSIVSATMSILKIKMEIPTRSTIHWNGMCWCVSAVMVGCSECGECVI